MSGRFQRILRHEVENGQIVRTWVLIEEKNKTQNEQTNHPMTLVHMSDILPENVPKIRIKQEEDIKMEVDQLEIEPSNHPQTTCTNTLPKITYDIPDFDFEPLNSHEILSTNNSPEIEHNYHQINEPQVIHLQRMEVEQAMMDSDVNSQIQSLTHENSHEFLPDPLQLGPEDIKHHLTENATNYMSEQHGDKNLPPVKKDKTRTNQKHLPIVKPKRTIEVTWQCRFCPYKNTYLENVNNSHHQGYLRKSLNKECKIKRKTCYYESHLHEM